MRRTGRPRPRSWPRSARRSSPAITTDELDVICHEACIAPGRLPEPAQLQRLPEVAVHVGQRGHLPRHPRQPRAAGRRHRQPRRDDLPGRRARRHQRDVAASARSTRSHGGWSASPASASSAASTRSGRAGRSPTSAGRSRTTPKANRFGVVRAFVGHGIGETFHTDLPILHYYDPGPARSWSRG